MNTRTPISFIVPVFNYGHYLEDTVNSICRGNLQPQDEILIVNDASTDNTAEVIQALAREIPQIRPLAHRHNKGCFTAGVNTAVEAAQHDLFFGLAADNMLVPDTISPLVDYLHAKQADVACFQELRFFSDDPAKPTHSWFFKEETTLADALAGHFWPGSDGNYMFSREIWLKAGRCDEFFGGLDSWSFGIKKLVAGAKMVALPNHYYLHRWGHESLFAREEKKGSLSINAFRALLPILDHLEPESVEYLFSKEGRSSWFENLPKRPLRLSGKEVGQVGSVVHHARQKDAFVKRVRRFVARKIAPRE